MEDRGLFHSKKHCFTISEVDTSRRARPSALLCLTQDIAGEHFERICGGGPASAADRSLMWIITRMQAAVERMPEYMETVTLETWTGKVSHGMFRRHYRIADGGGNTLVCASSVWALMRAEDRSLVMDPAARGVDVPACPGREEPEMPGRIRLPELTERACRAARYSELDMNGHLNNTRYLDWADDLISREYHESHELRSFSIHYRSEIRADAEAELRWALTDEGVLACRGFVSGSEAFTVTQQYREKA